MKTKTKRQLEELQERFDQLLSDAESNVLQWTRTLELLDAEKAKHAPTDDLPGFYL